MKKTFQIGDYIRFKPESVAFRYYWSFQVMLVVDSDEVKQSGIYHNTKIEKTHLYFKVISNKENPSYVGKYFSLHNSSEDMILYPEYKAIEDFNNDLKELLS